MKFIHLADLHIGKRHLGASLLEDQRYILEQIISYVHNEKPNVVLISGDVYDKSTPPPEAVMIFDEFLAQLVNENCDVLVISGNHDSAERIAFGHRLMKKSRVYMSPVFEQAVSPILLNDEFGDVCFYLLPFIKPVHVRKVYPEAEIQSYDDAIATVISHMNVDKSKRNVLLMHQFVTGAITCDSEVNAVGGVDQVSTAHLDDFDYVALGHIHTPQRITRDSIRYCGSPLKYSFSEVKHQKSVTVVEMYEKGRLEIRLLPLIPLRDTIELKGKYQELTEKSFYENMDREAYCSIILTDEDEEPFAVEKLRNIYPNLLKLEYDNTRMKLLTNLSGPTDVAEKEPIVMIDDFYKEWQGKSLSEEQRQHVIALLNQIRGM